MECARPRPDRGRPAQDVVYHNILMQPLIGRDQVRDAVAPRAESCSKIDWEVHPIAANADGALLTERTDRFVREGKALSVRVMGTFEVRDGRIAAWRDCFDLAEWTAQM